MQFNPGLFIYKAFMTTLAKLSAVQASIIHSARKLFSDDERKAIKASVFADVKRRFDLDHSTMLKASVNPDDADYCLVKVGGKSPNAGMAFSLNDSGLWDGCLVSPDAVAPAATADNRKWFSVSLDNLVQRYKDDAFLSAEDATDELPPGIDEVGASAYSHEGNVYFKAEPDDL